MVSKRLYLDFETYSPVDLQSNGSYAYITHPQFRVLCGSANGVKIASRKELIQLCATHTTIVAQNAGFERLILKKIIPKKVFDKLRFICTSFTSIYLGGPLSLANSSIFWGLNDTKLIEGKYLIKFFHTELSKDVPYSGVDKNVVAENKESLVRYCIKDQELLVPLLDKFLKIIKKEGLVKDYKKELEYYNDSLIINDNGIPIDLKYTDKLIDIREKWGKVSKDYFASTYKFNPASPKQVLAWINNPRIVSAAKGYIRGNWKLLTSEQKEMFRYKWNMISPQVKRIHNIKTICVLEPRLKNFLVHYGTVTGRYTSRGVNILNFPKGKPVEIDSTEGFIKEFGKNSGSKLTRTLRGVIAAPKGKYLITSDLRQIEFRLLMYGLGYNNVLNDLKEGKDIYLDFAKKVYGRECSKDSKERQIAKVLVLSLGYGGSARMAHGMVSAFSNVEYGIISEAYDVYHKLYPKVHEKIHKFERDIRSGKTHFTLPNGSKKFFSRMGNIKRIYGGLLIGWYFQSYAREVLFQKQNALLKAGFKVVFNVYDEIIIETSEKSDVKKVHEIMEEPIVWAPGLPLAAETKLVKRYGE